MVEIEDLQRRFTALEESNGRLSSDVRALTATLRVVNELGIEQRAAARRQEDTERKMREVAVENDDRLKRVRQSINLTTGALAVLLPVVSILVYLSLLQHVNSLLNDQNKNAFTSCTIRNQSTIDNANREQALADAEPVAKLKVIHSESAAKLRGAVNDCSRFLAKK